MILGGMLRDRFIKDHFMVNKEILVVDDEPEITKLLGDLLEGHGYKVDLAGDSLKAKDFLRQKKYLMVLADVNLPTESGLKILEYCAKSLEETPPFVFITGMHDPSIVASASKLGAVDVIEKPFDVADVLATVRFMEELGSDKIADLMGMINRISGINLGPDKRFLVETRLLRRTRQLALPSLDAYLDYFSKNRQQEVAHIISLVTTHTTQFFRESQHFDFLIDHGFAAILKNNIQTINVWSAAASTGEELYSAAICWHEFLRKSGSENSKVSFRGLGTDIDQKSIDKASKGIYQSTSVNRLSNDLVRQYFLFGRDNISNLVKVCDMIHSECRFSHYNLISPHGINERFDIIFLRNVLIYFKPETAQKIIDNVTNHLNNWGLLFLGYSESLNNINHKMINVGHSIYQKKSDVGNRAAPSSKSISGVSTLERQKVRVFIVDDSATIRATLRKILSKEKGFEVVGEAENPKAISKKPTTAWVDVVTLDLHMPEQDGLSYLKSISDDMHPPVVVISSVSEKEGIEVMNCLELGATDYVEKPSAADFSQAEEQIRDVLKVASKQRFRKSVSKAQSTILPTYSYDPDDLIVVGASTGGVEAIKLLLAGFPKQTPPILIVQHIPPAFSKTFANRLRQSSPILVTEACDGEEIEPNHAYIAPGGKQMGVKKNLKKLFISITDDSPVNRHKPSVDFLFNSVAQNCPKKNISAAVMTGMGDDGAQGLLNLRHQGAHTIAQDEESCVVFGMPKVAIDLGGAVEILPLYSIAYHLFSGLKKTKKAA